MQYYNTDTLHLQGALTHMALSQVQLTFTIHLQAEYNTDTLQGILIHTVQLTFTIQIQYIYRAP